MEKKYSIGLIAATLISVTVLSIGYRMQYNYLKEQEDSKNIQDRHPAVSAEGAAKKAELYYLAEKDGYIVVYQSDRTTVYEYTNIRMSDLPEDVRAEIKDGKTIESEEKLYGFLENYSS